MRHTLSALTAACLLTLGQSAWASATERTWLHQQARHIVQSLPDAEQIKTAALLQQWHSDSAQAKTSSQRHLPFHPVMGAVSAHLKQHYRQTALSHQKPATLVAWHWAKTEVRDPATHRPQLLLEPVMVQRWANQWQGAIEV